jgi:hypothetical protein
MTEKPPARSFPLVTLSLAVFPLLLLIVFFAYVFRARLVLGHWPSYNNPDPKQLGWWIQHSFLQLGFITFPAVALLATMFAIAGRFLSRDFPLWTLLAITAFACGILIAFARVDPGGFVAWFWD